MSRNEEKINRNRPAPRVRGFTIVEIAITLAVGAILVALAIPNVAGFVRTVRATSETNDFVGVLNRARSEALFRVGNMKLCASDTSVATPVCGGGATWNDGWILFNDCNSDGTPDTGTNTCDTDGDGTAETNETLVRVGDAPSGGDTLSGTVTEIVFLSNGTPLSGAQSFDVCTHGHDSSGLISINAVGRINTSQGTVSC